MNRIACIAAFAVLLFSPQAQGSDLKPMQADELKPGVSCRINKKAKPAGFAREKRERYRRRVLEVNDAEVVLEGHWFTHYQATRPALERIPIFGSYYFTRGVSFGSPKGEFKIAFSEIDAI